MKYHNFLPKLSFIPSIVICKDHAVFLSNPPSPPSPKKLGCHQDANKLFKSYLQCEEASLQSFAFLWLWH